MFFFILIVLIKEQHYYNKLEHNLHMNDMCVEQKCRRFLFCFNISNMADYRLN